MSGTNLPAKQASGALAPAYDYGTLAGAGFQNQTNEDVSIPFLGVLQDMSPLVKDRSTGAVPGELFNTVTGERFDGKTGVIFQPCSTKHVFVEWKPRNQGGGFVAIHELDSQVVTDARNNQKFGEYKTPAGNELNETYYMYGLLHRSENLDEQAGNAPEPMIIAFTSTKIKVYRAINTRLRTFLNGKAPLFANRLRITSKPDKNNEGDFHNFAIAPLIANDLAQSAIPPTVEGVEGLHPLLVIGDELRKTIEGGGGKVNYAATKGDGTGTRTKKGPNGDDIPF